MERQWNKVKMSTVKEIKRLASPELSALDITRLLGNGISRSTVRLILNRENLPYKRAAPKPKRKKKRTRFFQFEDFKGYYNI